MTILDEMLAKFPEDDDDAPLSEEVLQRIRDLDLTSCDFTESGCTDDDCYRCYSPLRPENLRTLAKNIAAAAMLCRAWNLRDQQPDWRPGCAIEGVA
jgi:hypothetical protein